MVLTVIVLGVLVRTLFLENKRIRSDLEARFKAIEDLDGPFACKLADAGPTPLNRALSLAIHLDIRFWAETLQLTSVELDEIRKSIRLHDVLSKQTALDDLDK